MEPLEESVYLDQVQLLAVDHPAGVDVYPNEYFASNPPYPPFKVVFSNKKNARPPAGAWDEHGHNVLPDLLAHHYFGDFKVLSFAGFTEPHTLELDLGEAYRGGPSGCSCTEKSNTSPPPACTPRIRRTSSRLRLMLKRRSPMESGFE